jgi:hypothetical protein
MSLANFLRSQTHQFAGPVKNPSVDSFTKTFVAAARLPNYTFGEQHPFERVSLSLTASSDGPLTSIDSGLYGSLLHQWMPELGLTYGRYSFGYQGDGVTKSFTLVAPKAVSLRNWGRPPIEENSTASTRNQY